MDENAFGSSRFNPFGTPGVLEGGQKVTCQHEGDLQRLMLAFPQCDARLTALEGKVTTLEENVRVRDLANEMVRSGRSDEQMAAEKRRNVYLGIAMLLMPVVTAVLNKLWK